MNNQENGIDSEHTTPKETNYLKELIRRRKEEKTSN